MNEFWSRPRLLYAAVFVWISITGGRFTASFLESESQRLDASQIGLVLAVQRLVGVVAGSITGIWADRLEERYPHRGRLCVLGIGCTVGSLVFGIHGLHWIFKATPFFRSFPWFAILRTVYAFATSLVFPILDGICLDFLKKKQQQQEHQEADRGSDHNENNETPPSAATDDYGKERLYGAISWALTNLTIGPILDYFAKTSDDDNGDEFWILYPMALGSTLLLLVSIWIYTKNNNGNGTSSYGRLTKRDSNIVLPDEEEEHDDSLQDEPDTETIGTHTPNAMMNEQSNLAYYWSILTNTFGASSYTIGFMVCLVTLASGQAIVNDLVFLFFESALKSSYTFMSLTVVLTVSFEIPIFQVAPLLLQRLGTNILLVIAVVAYVIRVIGYSLVPSSHPWIALLLEPMHGITYACSQTASVDFVSTKLDFGASGDNIVSDDPCDAPSNGNKPNDKSGNDGKEATGQGFLQFFVGMGSVFGLVFGGYAEDTYGPRIMYRISALVVSLGCLWFVVFLGATMPRIRRHQAIPQSEDATNNDGLELTPSSSTTLD